MSCNSTKMFVRRSTLTVCFSNQKITQLYYMYCLDMNVEATKAIEKIGIICGGNTYETNSCAYSKCMYANFTTLIS